MKIINSLVILAGATLLLASAGQSKAQYQPIGDDGIAASPKVRQMLNERRAIPAAMGGAEVPGYQIVGEAGIAASPKVRQMLNEEEVAARTPASGAQAAGYKPTGDDGITASPKLRQILDEQKGAFEIAPLK